MNALKLIKALAFVCCVTWQVTFAQAPAEQYPVDSASVVHAGVPQGELIQLPFTESKIFPGTTRTVTIYVPAQYDGKKPACLYVNQDAVQFKAPTVFDNLINSKEMPVTIGVFVTPGQVMAANTQTAINRNNRSYEYDGLGDNYARFLLTELLPFVEKQKTKDGRAVMLSKNANDRAIGGQSSGAIAGFNVAWERPESFSRVFSAISTFVGLRGGDRFATLIRKYEPKPIRIFLQDGTNDLNNYAGDWWITAQMMERAFKFAGYEVEHSWGDGAHNSTHATAIFPQAMRFLWKDYPAAVKAGISKNAYTSKILLPNEGWELMGDGYGFTEGITANAVGEVFFQDVPNSKTYKVGLDGEVKKLSIDAKKASGTAFGPDGKRYTIANATNQVISYDGNNKATIVAGGILNGNDLVISNNGNIYVTAPNGVDKSSKIYLIKPNGQKTVVDEGLKFANGLALSVDQTTLYICESATHWIYVYKINADGTLSNKQRLGWLHVPDDADNAWADGVKFDANGRMWVATRIGIQVLDEQSRVISIISTPGEDSPSNLCFGGSNFDTLYVTVGHKLYRRKVGVTGVKAFEKPFKPEIQRI